MSAWLRETAVVTWLELATILRSEETYRFYLLPALFFVPAVVLVAVFWTSVWRPTASVAMPPELPAEGGGLVGDVFLAAGFDVRDTEDPLRALERGEVGAAVLSVGRGDDAAQGLRSCEAPARWAAEVLVEDPYAGRLLDEVPSIAEALAIERATIEGDPTAPVGAATVVHVTAPRGRPDRTSALIALALLLALVTFVGYPLLCLAGVAERRGGVTESLLATPCRPSSLIVGRLVAALAVQGATCALFAANLWLLFPSDAAGALSVLEPADVAASVAVLLLADSLFLGAGAIAATVKGAANTGSFALLALVAAVAAGLFHDAPAWVPVAGVPGALSAGAGWTSAAATTALAVAVIAALCVAVGRSSHLKISPGGPT